MLHREKPSWGVHSICCPWPRNSNLVTVELGTFRHSSTLPAISMDFQKIKKQSNLNHLPDRPAMTSQRGSNRTPPQPSIVLSTYRQPFLEGTQISLIRPLAFPNHQLHNLLHFDTRLRNGGAVQPTPRGT